MNLRKLILFSLLVAFAAVANAQRIVSELESNSDMSMDARPDSLSSRAKGKTVPNDIWAWTLDEKYGNMTSTYVDTLQHLFMNSDFRQR